MPGPRSSLFAGREIFGMPLDKAALVAVSTFAAGLLVAWGISAVPQFFVQAEPSPSPSASASATVEPDVSVPPMPPISRELDNADAAAGVVTLAVAERGSGTFTAHQGDGTPDPGIDSVRWVSISFEDGIEVDTDAAATFIMDALTASQGWGADGRMQFVHTDGVADYRIMVASPYTAAAICPDNHVAADVGPVTEVTPSPDADSALAQGGDGAAYSAVADVGVEGPNPACAHDGIVVISMYDWTAGLAPFATDRTAARQYLVNHHLGHLFGHEESECVSGRAAVMDNQREDFPAECTVNPWPYPDAGQPGGGVPTP